MALSNNNSPSPDITHIKNHTEEIYHSIKRIFRHRRADIEDQRQIITTTRKWVEKILRITSCERRVAIGNAVSSIICTLDEVSIQLAVNRKKKRLQALMKSTEYTPQKRKRRQSAKYSDLHNAGYIDSDEEDDLPNLYLSNSNRHQRAKRSSCSMKDAINAPVSKPVEDDIDLMVKTLKRDVYKQLATFDTNEIKAALVNDKQDIGCDNIIQAKIKELVSTVLNRVEVHPSSPALRLSAIITIDNLHGLLELRNLGYRSLLTELLQADYSWSLNFYAEILSECSMYEAPIRLLQSLTALMQRALNVHKLQSIEHCVELRRAISHIMVRRQSVLSSCGHKSKYCSILKKEIGEYRCVCDNMSLQFDSISHWISPSMSKDVKEQTIYTLQSEGILSLFSINEDDDDCTEQPATTSETYPFPESMSLRAAYDRLGYEGDRDDLISDAKLYEQTVMQQDYSDPLHYKDECGPLSNMSDDVLVNVLSFLGFRSLARASQCCKSWNRASNSSTMWAGVYFNKYRRRCKFEFEYTPNDDAASIIQRNSSFKGFLTRCHTQEQIEGHDFDFKHIFKSRYTKEKIGNARTCNVIGCMYMIHNKTPDQYASHMKRHETSIRVKSNHNKRCNTLTNKVQDLQEQTAEWTEFNTPVQNKIVKINSPKSVLRDLIFPYLDYRSVLVSSRVCKLWNELSRSTILWTAYYQHHFGACSIKWSSPSDSNWKQVFQTKMIATKRVEDCRNPLGWPLCVCSVPNCNKEFQSKVLFKLHMIKHEEMYCCEVKKVMVSTDWR